MAAARRRNSLFILRSRGRRGGCARNVDGLRSVYHDPMSLLRSLVNLLARATKETSNIIIIFFFFANVNTIFSISLHFFIAISFEEIFRFQSAASSSRAPISCNSEIHNERNLLKRIITLLHRVLMSAAK